MSLLRAALTTAGKDLRIFFRDRTGMLLGFALPIALVAVLGFVNGIAFGGEGGLSRTTLWVADLDGSEESRAFVEELRESSTLRVRPGPKEQPEGAEALRQKVEDGDAHHALVLDEGFSQALRAGESPPMRMFRDPDRDLEEQMVSVGLMRAFFAAGGPELAPLVTARALTLAGLPEEWRQRILGVTRGFSASVQTLFEEADRDGLLEAEGEGGGGGFERVFRDLVPVERVDLRPPERPKRLTYVLAQSVSGIAVMMLMFGLVACATTMIKEREEGTLQRLLASPAPREAFLLGKFFFTAVSGAIQLVLLFAFGAAVFRVDVLADPPTLLVVSLATLVAVTAFGMLVAASARTSKQAEGLSTLVILVMSAVGGAWYPIQMHDLPPLAAAVTRSTLTYWAMTGYQGLFWHGRHWTEASMLGSIGVLLGFGFVASAAAALLYRKRYVGR